jgi:hypothetical protein
MDYTAEVFYHSFPRIRPGQHVKDTIPTGLQVLACIKEMGLVLAPEIVVWKQSLVSGEYRTITIRQRRISFTALSRTQLKTHGERFGPFSLAFRIDVLRRLGALPVIYMPQNITDERGYDTVGPTVVAEMADIKYMVNQLRNLRQLTDPKYLLSITPGAQEVAEDCTFNLRNMDPTGNIVASYQIPIKTVKDFLSYIGYRNAPFELMDGVLTLVQSLFYPTDDQIHDKQLDYYRQREWRLVAGLALHGKSQTRSLTGAEKDRLVAIDPNFWRKELSDGKTSFRRVDDACLIESAAGQPIGEIVSEVIVPAEAYDEARLLLGEKVLTLGTNREGI